MFNRLVKYGIGLFFNLLHLKIGGLNFDFSLLVLGPPGSLGLNQCWCFGCFAAFLANLRHREVLLDSRDSSPAISSDCSYLM